ncbi:MAG: hypothetical protein PWQ76_839 [Clostridiales bacterium]|jgi:PHD/YefM family antitoxin component YafN of YafNO toxin-antitoxin module|nr:prevent-host-death family protein [Oscillospiraceae bacterium]MDN5378584.1 hypothetical protein [Clostridiales bacterium]
MQIKPSASIRQNYNEISALCKSTKEPVFLTKNGEGDLVVMDIETFTRREKMLKLREELLSVEEDRLTGLTGFDIDELDNFLTSIIDEVGHGKQD